MKISAIQSYGATSPVHRMNKGRKNNTTLPTPKQKGDEVSFQGKNAIKGAGIGAAFGLGALAILSGGLAAPVAYGVYAALMGTAGGVLGHVADKVNEENNPKNNKNSEKEE